MLPVSGYNYLKIDVLFLMFEALSSLTNTSLLPEQAHNKKAVNINQNQWLTQAISSLEHALLT